MVCPENFFDPLNGTLTEIFLATGGGVGGGGHKKNIFKCPFFSEKCSSEPGPPNFSKLPTPLALTSFGHDTQAWLFRTLESIEFSFSNFYIYCC